MPPRAGMPAWPFSADSYTLFTPSLTRCDPRGAVADLRCAAHAVVVALRARRLDDLLARALGGALPSRARRTPRRGPSIGAGLVRHERRRRASPRRRSDSLLPPLAGIARMPPIACSKESLSPCATILAHAALSPSFGEPASPVSWHVLHTCPVDLLAGEHAFRSGRLGEHDGADGLDPRQHDACRFRSPFSPLVTSCETITATAIGTMNASSTTMTSCFGVLIADECSSVMVAGWRGILASARRGAKANAGTAADLTRDYTVPATSRGTAHWTGSLRERYNLRFAPVAQLDRVLVSEAKGHRFESCRARHLQTGACHVEVCLDRGARSAGRRAGGGAVHGR